MKNSAALILLNYVDYLQTITFVKKIEKYKSIDYIIIVDNGSPNDSYRKLKECESEKISVIQCEKNEGYAKGNNYGIKYAIQKYHPEYVMICNPDIFFEEAVVEYLIEKIQILPQNTGLLAPQMLEITGKPDVSAWKLPNRRNIYLNNFIILRKWLHYLEYTKKELQNKENKVEVLPGSFLFCRTKVLQEMEFFDERTFLYGEENILCYKLKKAGYENILLKNVSYEHIHGKTINQEITSIRKKFKFCYDSFRIYAKDYLKMTKAEIFLFRVTFEIGLCNFIFASKIKKFLSKNR